MNRQNLMDQAQKIVTLYACRGLEEQKCEEMTRWVERFFRDHVSRLSRSEIMDRLATPMKALHWFSGYLCNTANFRCCSKAAADDGTCRLAA
ncbi:hypothetical protein DSCW_32240 [Desulfosarcina widdelii]|uniref:Uncharacterized protein n=1 Tax=Desulfosarcina widdelii TaxID=947919 RepID=A0A5K7ZIC2_9BACT|nr:hypothetical protein [Desulfosarcina widdelii]BBO75807.1 hypothetical protein DSCW_32240 [Desulfosarcina widdelii]